MVKYYRGSNNGYDEDINPRVVDAEFFSVDEDFFPGQTVPDNEDQ
jgi:hypothetical protein